MLIKVLESAEPHMYAFPAPWVPARGTLATAPDGAVAAVTRHALACLARVLMLCSPDETVELVPYVARAVALYEDSVLQVLCSDGGGGCGRG